jgi:hypothetical protein
MSVVAQVMLINPRKRLQEGYSYYFGTEAFVVAAGFFFANSPDDAGSAIVAFAMLALAAYVPQQLGAMFNEEMLGPNLGLLCAANLVIVMGVSIADLAVAASVLSLVLTTIAARLAWDGQTSDERTLGQAAAKGNASNFFLRLGAFLPLPVLMFLVFLLMPAIAWYAVVLVCMTIKLLFFLWIRHGWKQS